MHFSFLGVETQVTATCWVSTILEAAQKIVNFRDSVRRSLGLLWVFILSGLCTLSVFKILTCAVRAAL